MAKKRECEHGSKRCKKEPGEFCTAKLLKVRNGVMKVDV